MSEKIEVTEEMVMDRLTDTLIELGHPVNPRRKAIVAAMGAIDGNHPFDARATAGLLLAGVRYTNGRYETVGGRRAR